MEPKELAGRFLRCIPEFVIGLLVLVALGIHIGNNAPLPSDILQVCESSATISCVRNPSFLLNGTETVSNVVPCLCVSDRSFFYGCIAAGGFFYHISRTLFNTVAATKLVFIVSFVFGVMGYSFLFVGVALSISESMSPAAMAVGAILGVASLVSFFDSIYEFFKRRRELDYSLI